ncbi:hypothetical protein niasHT_017640 [Heterodera trifolii]|uniref:Uncharacterized protein n=1 Tax=Heterodera trifolii TaxID=157864 RepID=A0ABD2L843_9BILA
MCLALGYHPRVWHCPIWHDTLKQSAGIWQPNFGGEALAKLDVPPLNRRTGEFDNRYCGRGPGLIWRDTLKGRGGAGGPSKFGRRGPVKFGMAPLGNLHVQFGMTPLKAERVGGICLPNLGGEGLSNLA